MQKIQLVVRKGKRKIVMKITPPKPFTFKKGKRAVLLLHGFTGNSADVRMLGRFLRKGRLYMSCTNLSWPWVRT